MENITITMNNNGDLTCADPYGGYIEELRARQLVISVNSFFRSSVISYFTISFEPYGLGKKIVTDNIYKSSNTGEVTYTPGDGTITCPIFDYISVSPKVLIQIDGYETDENSDVCAIYKSGVLELRFSESLVGEKIIPDMTNAELKLSERISDMIDDELESLVITTDNLASSAVTSAKIGSKEVKTVNINDSAVTNAKIGDGQVTGSKIYGALGNQTDNQYKIQTDNIANRAVTGYKIADLTIRNQNLGDGQVYGSKLYGSAEGQTTNANKIQTNNIANQAVTGAKIYQGDDNSLRIHYQSIADEAIKTSKIASDAVTTPKIADGSVTGSKLYGAVSGQVDDRQKIQTNSIANGAVTKSKLSSEVCSQIDKTTASNILAGTSIDFISYSHTNSSPYTINTEAEYVSNCKKGYTSIKGDIRLTSDNKLIMCHDAGITLNSSGKITSYNENNNILIHDITYDECMEKQYSDNSYVCDFDTYIRTCKKYGKMAAFDLRNEYLADTCEEMFRILDKYNMRGNCLVACNHINSANAVRNMDDSILIGFGGSEQSNGVNIKKRLDQAIGLGNCVYFALDFPNGHNGRTGINALDYKFDDGNGNMVTAIEYAHNNGIRFYECVITGNTETYSGETVDIIDYCIKKGVEGFTTCDNLPYKTKYLSELADDNMHRTVTDAEKATWNGKANISDIPTKTSDITNDSGFLTDHQDISGKESVSNKVTTIDASSPSNTEYPSEKATVDYIKSQRGKMRVVPPEKTYYCGTDGKIIDVTSSLSYVGNYYIDSNGNPVADGNNYCYALDLSQFAPVSIKTATRSTSWYSYAFYTSGNNFISGGKLSNGSNNNQNVWNFETVNISDIPANAVKMLVVRYTATDNAIQNFFVKGKVKKSVVDCFDEWLTDEAPCAVIYKHAEAPTKIYRVGSGRTPSTTEFTTLIGAVAQWVTDGKPCATIFVDSGVYVTQNDPTGPSNPLTINGGENRLTIIGEDKDATIVKSTTGKYVHPAINIQGGNVTIKNITFIADHSDNSSFAYLDPDREANGKQPNSAYAVHCDGGDSVDIVSGVIEFENCNMWSWQSCGLGCGTVMNGHVVVKNCDIRSFVPGTATDEGSTAQDATAEQKEAHALYVHGTRGAIVYHMSPKTKDGGNITIGSSNESFTLINSNIYLKGGTKTVNVLNNSETDFFSLVTFIDNTFRNDTENCNLVPVPTGTTNVHLGGLSGGNNVETVNSNSSDYSLLIK